MSASKPHSHLPELLSELHRTEAGASLLSHIHQGHRNIEVSGLTPSAAAALVAWLQRELPTRSVVVVTDGVKSQEIFLQDVFTCLQPGKDAPQPMVYPPWDILPHETKLPHSDVISERLETLVTLMDVKLARSRVVVTSCLALCQPTFAPGELAGRTRRFHKGDTANPLDLIEWLEEQGYEPEAQVTGKGELSWRGGIVDVFPMSSPWPVRMEFFGDEIESLREFDPQTQLSREEIQRVVLPPAGELSLLRRKSTDSAALPIKSGLLSEHIERNSIWLIVDANAVHDQALKYRQQVQPNDPLFVSWEDVETSIANHGGCAIVSEVVASGGNLQDFALVSECEKFRDPMEMDPPKILSLESSTSINLGFQSLDAFRVVGSVLPDPQIAESQRREFFHQMHRWMRAGYGLRVYCNNDGEAQRFGEIWLEYGLVAEAEINPTQSQLQPHVEVGTLSRGFIHEESRQVVVTDAEIFGRYKVARPRRMKSSHASAMKSAFEIDFTDFEEGDFVVHLQYGIGRYKGLEILPPNRRRGDAKVSPSNQEGQECLVIEFAASQAGDELPRLFVPIREAHLVSKYVGAGKARPILNHLGGTRWTKAKEHAQKAVRDLAADLLSVQATRAIQPGHAFAPDSPWQREFESAFVYEETVDQLKAIEAVKRDMESPRPMERLICGDVGFGKTEVAIRAVFKAVMGGRQAAILVPTTVLAQQHYNNFRERMADYPIRIDLLSRFRTPRQQRAVLEAAANGSVDLVIGTHRLIQPDLLFKNLGLVIVDEEQRFGVKHKETFKLLRKTVDVLTLSATPIPRTLYLALTGARDLSTLETPPQDRLPVETIVGNYDERVIRDAIRREIQRGGQVYFLHNRVSTIEAVAMKLRDLVPEARFVIGHGQMDPDELEKVMTQFVSAEADVLVSTTIIESGLDIPNANTIIIDRADRFGLSELYQLRGRVGRYRHQAFAYLMLPRHAQLLTEARKRMSAIKQYSALGSGFKIAMRDLEIRGAGNLLGAQQSGHITAVGFDLYCQLLKQSVDSLKGEKVQPRVDVRVSIDFLALNPGEEGRVTQDAFDVVRKGSQKGGIPIEVPRETAVSWGDDSTNDRSERKVVSPVKRTPAYLPLDYVREPAHRLEIYRELAQARDPTSVVRIQKEMEDRFGPVPAGVSLLLMVCDLRVVAASRQVTSVEVVDDKVKLTRNGDLITLSGQFPRLMKRDAKARLMELKRLLMSVSSSP